MVTSRRQRSSISSLCLFLSQLCVMFTFRKGKGVGVRLRVVRDGVSRVRVSQLIWELGLEIRDFIKKYG